MAVHDVFSCYTVSPRSFAKFELTYNSELPNQKNIEKKINALAHVLPEIAKVML